MDRFEKRTGKWVLVSSETPRVAMCQSWRMRAVQLKRGGLVRDSLRNSSSLETFKVAGRLRQPHGTRAAGRSLVRVSETVPF